MGTIPLSKLTREDVDVWVNAMRDAGAAGGTIQNRARLSMGALGRAVKDGHLAGNPCECVGCPAPTKEMVFLTRYENRALAGLTAAVDTGLIASVV